MNNKLLPENEHKQREKAKKNYLLSEYAHFIEFQYNLELSESECYLYETQLRYSVNKGLGTIETGLAVEFDVCNVLGDIVQSYDGVSVDEKNPLFMGKDLERIANTCSNEPIDDLRYFACNIGNAIEKLTAIIKTSNNASRFVQIQEYAIRYQCFKGEYYRYICKTFNDVVNAILHYLFEHGYKFAMCVHCERYFATKALKQRYCRRKTHYTGYEHLDCEQAVRNIHQKLKRQYDRVNDRLKKRTGKDRDVLCNKFGLDCQTKSYISELLSISDLEMYENILKPYIEDRRFKNAKKN